MKRLSETVFLLLTILFLSSAVGLDQATYYFAKKLSAAGRYADAVTECRKIVYQYPDSRYYLAALYELAKNYRLSGRPAKAARAFKKLYEKSKTLVQKQRAIYGMGISEYDAGRWQKAFEILNAFNTRFAESSLQPTALLYMGLALEKQEKKQAALNLYRNLASLYPVTREGQTALSRIKAISQSVTVKDSSEPVEAQAIKAAPLITNDTVIESNTAPVQVEPPLSFSGRVEGLELLQKKKIKVVKKTKVLKPMTPVTIGTNIVTITRTNNVVLTNVSVLTQKVKTPDTNAIAVNYQEKLVKKKQEEIERMRRLLEIKARLLELKEKAIQDKTEILTQKKENDS